MRIVQESAQVPGSLFRLSHSGVTLNSVTRVKKNGCSEGETGAMCAVTFLGTQDLRITETLLERDNKLTLIKLSMIFMPLDVCIF